LAVDPKNDRRANNRTLYETPVSQENLDSGVFTYCTMYNYSKDGLYFESDTQLNPGEEIFIGIENSPYCVKFYNPDARVASTLQKSVCEPGQLQPETLKTGKEQRKHTRYPYNKAINYFAQNQRFEGVIKNICRSGAFIQSGHKFTVGEKLSMVLPFIKKQDGAMVKGEVIWIDKKGFGVKFKKTRNRL
jgi:Tfp pilus assembly protein PilZ